MFLVPVSRRTPVLSRSFGSLFDDAVFNRFLNAVTTVDPSTLVRTPALDVSETERAYSVTLDLPGIAKSDVKITIDGRRVDLEAQAAKAIEAPKDGDRVLHTERSAVRYARSFTLPVEVDQAASEATLENGVLTLTLVKKQPATTQLQIK